MNKCKFGYMCIKGVQYYKKNSILVHNAGNRQLGHNSLEEIDVLIVTYSTCLDSVALTADSFSIGDGLGL